jgi:hypothetical protein
MKLLSNVVFYLFIAFLLYAIYGAIFPAESSGLTAGDKKALELIIDEPKVIDATITSVGVLYATVLDDGTRRDGYAAYLCEVLKEHGSNANRVKVVQHNTTKHPDKDNAYGILLGSNRCGS